MREPTAAWLELHDALRHGAVAQDVLARADRELAEWFKDLDGAVAAHVQDTVQGRDTAPVRRTRPPRDSADPLDPARRGRRPRRGPTTAPPAVEFDDPVRNVLARAVRAVAVLVVRRFRPAVSGRRARAVRRGRPLLPAPATTARAPRAHRVVARPRRRTARPSRGVGTRLVAVAGALVLCLVALGATLLIVDRGASAPLDVAPATRAEAVAWLAGNVAADARLVVHPDLQESVEAVLPGREIVPPGQASGSAYDLFVGPSGGGTGGDLLQATFGTLEVRQPPGRVSWEAARAERRSAGQSLVANPRLQVSPAAWTDLVEGDVDTRLTDLVGAVLQRTSLEIAAFQRGPGESTDAPIRAMEVTAAAEIRVGDGAEAAMSVRSLLMDVPLELRADGLALATESNVPALLVRMSLPSR